MACTGMRPLATSWPPDRRTATATGAAQRFSQMSTAADVPARARSRPPRGPPRRACPTTRPRTRRRRRPRSGSPISSAADGAVLALHHEGDVEDADDAAVDEVDHAAAPPRRSAAGRATRERCSRSGPSLRVCSLTACSFADCGLMIRSARAGAIIRLWLIVGLIVCTGAGDEPPWSSRRQPASRPCTAAAPMIGSLGQRQAKAATG